MSFHCGLFHCLNQRPELLQGPRKERKKEGVIKPQTQVGNHFVCTGITKGKTPVPICSPKLSALFDGADFWMGDHLDKIPCAELLGKSGWHSGHQSRLPPLLQCCMWIEFQSIST